MRLLSSSSVAFLFVLSFPAAQAQVSRPPDAIPQSPVITVTLGTDQTALVKTAQGITTRIAFPDKVTESICGDLYDPSSGKGTFVVQNSGSDVFLKPVATRGVSNLFVMTGEGDNRRIYHFDLSVVSVPQAHRVVNVINAARSRPPAPVSPEPFVSKAPGNAGGLSLKEPTRQMTIDPANTSVFTTSKVSNTQVDPVSEPPGRIIGNSNPPEPPPPLKISEKDERKVEPLKREQLKQEPPKVIRKSGGVVSGEAIRRVEPVYPARAKASRVSGTVLVEVTVDEAGKVIGARSLSGHPLLIDAALHAARDWKFNPTRVSGQPVKVVRTITFNFSL